MKISFRFVIALALIAAGVAVCAPSPGASSEHFVIVNNNDNFFRAQGDNYGTVLKLAGTKQNAVLNQAALLATGVQSSGGGPIPSVQVVRVGADICVFLVTFTYQIPNEISAFKYPGLALVGNYSDSNVPDYDSAVTIAAGGGYLYATYGNYLASWAIGTGCTLSLAQTYTVNTPGVEGMAVTPNGETLVLSEAAGSFCCVDSFSIGPNGALTEHGPYELEGAYSAWGMDITADGKYAIFAGVPYCPYGCGGFVMVFPINSNGSLGGEEDFGNSGYGLGNNGFSYVRLSPDEKYLYADGGNIITALGFHENPVNITGGCATTLRMISGISGWSLATAATSGAGGAVYVAEGNLETGQGAVGLLSMNTTTGCTTEAPASPFVLSGAKAVAVSLAAWPPRPF